MTQIIETEQNKDVEVFTSAIRDTAAKMAGINSVLLSLTPEQLQTLQNSVLLDGLKSEFKNIVSIAGIDAESEKQKFLTQFKSVHTRDAYRKPLERLELFAKKIDKNILCMDYKDADDFILDLQNDKGGAYSKRQRSAESIRLDVASVSSFYTFLERRHESIKNPFRGTKARPQKQASKKRVEKYEGIESWSDDINVITQELPARLAAAVCVMAFRGLRIGALPNLFINGDRFITDTKGKEQRGNVGEDVIDFLAKSGLDKKRPFDYLNKEYAERKAENERGGSDRAPTPPEQCLKMQITRRIKRLYKQGKITRLFTPHDFRHFYAVKEYSAHKDIHRLSKLLNHSSVQITEIYLKGLNILD